jgi:hypothetical protein
MKQKHLAGWFVMTGKREEMTKPEHFKTKHNSCVKCAYFVSAWNQPNHNCYDQTRENLEHKFVIDPSLDTSRCNCDDFKEMK